MPNMTPYEVSVLPEGEVHGRRATAEDFGGGQGLDNIGQSLSHAAKVFSDVQDDQARVWASTAASTQETAAKQQWNQQVNSLDPTAPDYGQKLASLTDDASSMWDDGAASVQANAPSSRAAAYAGELLTRAKAQFAGVAMAQQSKLNADFTTGLVKDGISKGTDLIAASPDNDTVMRLTEQQIQTIAGMKTIDPAVKQNLVENVKNTYALAQAQTLAQSNPGMFLRGVSADAGVQTPPAFSAPGLTVADGTASPTMVNAVIQQESGGNSAAVSPKGARGLMQLMPATAASVGVTNIDDPQQNVAGGTAYLNQQLNTFGGDPRLALAAYDAGPGAVRALQAKYGASYEAIAAHLPAETQKYIPSVLAHAGVTGPVSSLPQVQPLTEPQIAAAHPPLAGWDNLSWPQKVAVIRQAESKQGEALSSGRGQLRGSLADANAMALAGQKLDPQTEQQFSQQNLNTYFGPAEGARLYAEHTAAVQFGQFKQQVAVMPAAQRDALVAKSMPSGAGAEASLPMWEQMAAAAQSAAADQQKQWTDYAIQNGISGAKPLDMSSDQSMLASLSDRQKLMQTGQQEYGIAKPTVFSTQEAAAIGGKLDKMDPDQRFAFMANMGRALNDPAARQVAFNQIAPGRQDLVNATDIALLPASIKLGDGETQTAQQISKLVMTGDYILNGGYNKAGKAGSEDAPQPGGKGALGLNTKAFDQAFQTYLGPNAFAGDDAGRQNRMGQQVYRMALDYYAADAQARGLDASQPADKDVQRAIDAVTGGVWKRGNSTLFAPYGTDVQTFQDQWQPRAKQALLSAGYDEKYVDAGMSGLRPYNLKDGKYGFMSGTKQLHTADGRAPVIVDYSLPAPPPPAPFFRQTANRAAMSPVIAIGK